MAHLHARTPSPVHSPSHHPDSLADHLGCDRTRLYERAVNGLSEALHVLRSNPKSVIELQHALGRGMRGVTALKRLTTLGGAMEDPHLARDGVAAPQSPQRLDEAPAFQATVLTKKRRQRRYFDAHYKRQVAQLIRQQRLTISQVSKELNLTYSAVRRWLLDFDAQQASATHRSSGTTMTASSTAPKLSEAEQRIGQLEERLQQLQADNELLKKASALFAREIYNPSAVPGQ